MTRFLLGLIFVGCLFSAVRAQAQSGDFMWEPSIENALKRSKTEKKPVLVCMHKDKEIACTRMIALYDDPDVRAKMSEFICVATNITYHKEVKRKINGEEKECCPQFKTIDCDAHVTSESIMRQKILQDMNVKVPQHVCLDADGKVLLAKIYEMKRSALLAWLDRAKLAYGGISEAALDAQTQALLNIVKTGPIADKEKAVKEVLDGNTEAKTRLLFGAIQEIEAPADRVACIRAMGYDQYAHAGIILVQWLKDENTDIVNAAVVSLEETKAPGVEKPLLELFGKTKEPEIKKDCLRALGPCGGNDPEVKKLLLAQAKSNDDKLWIAAHMSLGYFLADEDVKKMMLADYAKERDLTMKTAILFAFQNSGLAGLASDVEKLRAEEKNAQLKTYADHVANTLNGVKATISGKQARQLTKPLFARDKVERNRLKDWGKN